MAAIFALISTYSALLKQIYGPGGENGPQNLKFEVGPLYTELVENVDPNGNGGFNTPFPVGVGGGGGVGNTFTNAQGNQTPSSSFAFLMTPTQYFGLVTIDSLLLQASVGNEEAYVKARVWEIDNVRRQMQIMIAADMYGDGTGLRGIVGAYTGATTVFTLATLSDVIKFDTGLTIVAAASTTPTTPRTGQGTISSIQFTGANQGNITAATNWDTLITGFNSTGTGDFLYIQGSINLALAGLRAWIPTAPVGGADNFYGVNRSNNSRLQGIFYNGVNFNVREAITNALAIAQVQGAMPTKCYLSYARFAQFSLLMQSDGRYMSQPNGGISGFAELEVVLGANKLTVVADRWCNDNDGWLLDPRDWKLLAVGKVPHFVESDIGSVILRVPSASAFECRLEAFVNLACHAPGHQVRIQFAPLPT
jgi:hypothetical protein